METKYSTFSAKKPSILTTGIAFGTNEMAETGVSMALNGGKMYAIEGMTGDMDDGIMKELMQDGLSSAMSMWSGAMMQKQEVVLSSAYNLGRTTVLGYIGSSKALAHMKTLKGKKLGMFSKIFGKSEEAKATNARLIADFTKMDIDSTSNSDNPLAKHNQMSSKLQFESLQVNKEGVNSRLAKIQIDGIRDSFEMKLKTSSFTQKDKVLIQKLTGVRNVSDDYIKKLNTLSASMVFQDSNGNWIGGNEAMVSMLNSMNFNRVN